MPKIKAILFDLDNTLIDFMRMKKESCNAAVEAMISAGLKLDKEKAIKVLFGLYDKYGIEYQLIFQKFLKKINKKVDYKILASGIVAYRKYQAGVLKPYQNVVPVLSELKKKGFKLAIISDAPKLRAWIRLVEMKIENFFDVVVCFEDTKEIKPSKLPFEKALRQLNLKPEECIMVGDWPERDIEGAKALGMKTVFAKYGSLKADAKIDADYKINDIKELLDLYFESRP